MRRRWERIAFVYATNSWTKNTYTGNSTGALTGSHTFYVSYVGSIVNITWQAHTGTCTASKITFNTQISASYRPSSSLYFYCHGQNAGATETVILEIQSDGDIIVGATKSNSNFTAGTGGIYAGSVSYRIF